jgi:alkylation response protein AidB-like acyl-CoA dehydrogenase
MRTTAVRKGINMLQWIKNFDTNGVYADYYIVAAKTKPDIGNKGISIS